MNAFPISNLPPGYRLDGFDRDLARRQRALAQERVDRLEEQRELGRPSFAKQMESDPIQSGWNRELCRYACWCNYCKVTESGAMSVMQARAPHFVKEHQKCRDAAGWKIQP